MLPPVQRQSYQEFQNRLQSLHHCTLAPEIERSAIIAQFQAVKAFFEDEITLFKGDDLPPDDVSRWQSLQTEIYKQMRLLDRDILLLQAARNSSTIQSRVSSLGDRLHTLIEYCQILL